MVDGMGVFVLLCVHITKQVNQELPVGRHKGVFLFTIIVHLVSAVFTFVQKLSSCRIPFCDA
jgi:hypothetical protein